MQNELPFIIDSFELKTENPKDALYFWDELSGIDCRKLKFSPYGEGTIPIPTFHRENYEIMSSEAGISQFQNTYLRGIPDLLESIAKNMRNFYHRDINACENIIVFDGANKTISAILEANCGEGEEILIFEPYYPTHLLVMSKLKNYIIRLCQFDVVLNENGETQYQFNIENFKKAMRQNVKVVIIINPHNPAAYVFSQEDMEQISEVLQNFPETVVIEDNAHFAYIMTDSVIPGQFSAIGRNFEKTYNVFSGGKLFNTNGMRIGWTISCKQLIDKLEKSRFHNFSCVSSIEQLIAAKSLESMHEKYLEHTDYLEYLAVTINEKTQKIAEILRKYKIIPLRTMGTFYLNADISNIVHEIPKEYFYNILSQEKTLNPDKAFCRWLLEYNIGFMPHSASTKNCEKYHHIIRIAANRTDEEINLIDDSLNLILSKN
jgi:aspartate/methionine/tyrosine aminotransferase